MGREERYGIADLNREGMGSNGSRAAICGSDLNDGELNDGKICTHLGTFGEFAFKMVIQKAGGRQRFFVLVSARIGLCKQILLFSNLQPFSKSPIDTLPYTKVWKPNF
jgi:hypothetical protein